MIKSQLCKSQNPEFNDIMIQLDFLQPLSEIEILREEIRQVRASNDKVRKGLFARHGELAKLYIETKNRLDILEMHICKRPNVKPDLHEKNADIISLF